MSMDDDYRALLNKMAAKRAVERFLLTLIALSVLVIGVMLFLQNRSLTTEIKNQQQAAKQTQQQYEASQRQILKLQTESQTQTADILNYIQCIAELFAQPNRTNLILDTVPTCRISATAQTSANANLYATVPTTPRTSNPNAQQPTTSEPPKSGSTAQPKQATTSSSQPAAAPGASQPSFVKRAVTWVQEHLAKTLALA